MLPDKLPAPIFHSIWCEFCETSRNQYEDSGKINIDIGVLDFNNIKYGQESCSKVITAP